MVSALWKRPLGRRNGWRRSSLTSRTHHCLLCEPPCLPADSWAIAMGLPYPQQGPRRWSWAGGGQPRCCGSPGRAPHPAGFQPQFPSWSRRAGQPEWAQQSSTVSVPDFQFRSKTRPKQTRKQKRKPGLILASGFSFLSQPAPNAVWGPRGKASQQAHCKALASFYSPASITVPSVTRKLCPLAMELPQYSS